MERDGKLRSDDEDNIHTFHVCSAAKDWLPTVKVEAHDPYKMGLQIGQRFAPLIRSRISHDLILRNELLPFVETAEGQDLMRVLSDSNKKRYPRYWKELEGTAHGSGVPLLELLILNFRKEISPFLRSKPVEQNFGIADECSDVLVCGCMKIIAHNEDANVSVKDHVYIIHATLPISGAFIAYTYAGELPSCAFGVNSYGVAFTLNSVPLSPEEVVAGGIGRNFISRDLLEATSSVDALERICINQMSVGHSYNIMDMNVQRIINVETASEGRYSVREIGSDPFFHANMYLHLQVSQIYDKSSICRQERANELPKSSKMEVLSLLGDTNNQDYPVYMEGPNLCTLCTVFIDMDTRTLTVYQENPTLQLVGLKFTMDDFFNHSDMS